MDSSGSDSEEFYECDDDYEVDKLTLKDVDCNKIKHPDVDHKQSANQIKLEEKKICVTKETDTTTESQVNNNPENKSPKPQSNNNKDDNQGNKARPEFGVPPARVTCWFPEIKEHIQQNRQAYEENASYTTLSTNVDNSEHESAQETAMTMIDRQTTSNVDAINQNIQKSHEKSENAEEKSETNEVEEMSTISKAIEIVPQTDNNSEIEVKNDDSAIDNEDNMWDDNENWEDNEIPSKLMEDKKCTISEKSTFTNNKVEEAQSQTDRKESTNKDVVDVDSEDNNMWGNQDDWGDINEPVVQASKEISTKIKEIKKPLDKIATNEPKPAKTDHVEEDLWDNNDGWDKDGWDMDTPQTSAKTDGDLWGEGDNWENDEAKGPEPEKKIQSAFSSLTDKEDSSWGGWGTWGISSVLSTAANITTSVSQGFTNALETGMGVPDPTELARWHKQEAQLMGTSTKDEDTQRGQPQEDKPFDKSRSFGLSNFVSGVSTITKLVETTGTKVISGGLGTLETIGKKTYEVLQENDPQLKKKRAFLKHLEGNKPVLSQMLREAKERAESENQERESKHFAKKANYETMFDDYQGLVHLEALEMLSKQCDIKVQMIMAQSTSDSSEMAETMEQIKDLCELTTEEDDEETWNIDELKEKIQTAIADINVPISCDTLFDTLGMVLSWIKETQSENCNEIHSHAIEHLAQITAMAVEQYHKGGELLLVKDHRSTADEADSLVQLTTALSALITILSTQYSEKLKHLAVNTPNKDEVKGLISNIYLEAANSSRYIEDAFQLLIPVIQVGAV